MAGESSVGSLILSAGVPVEGVKIFSATMVAQRTELGESVTRWLANNPRCQPTEFVITQSSDRSYHCISIVVFYSERIRGETW